RGRSAKGRQPRPAPVQPEKHVDVRGQAGQQHGRLAPDHEVSAGRPGLTPGRPGYNEFQTVDAPGWLGLARGIGQKSDGYARIVAQAPVQLLWLRAAEGEHAFGEPVVAAEPSAPRPDLPLGRPAYSCP